MAKPKALLLVTMEPSAADEQEFQDWYDTEHVPERAAIPGFLSAQRYVCVQGWPRYVAFYDLAYHEVLNEPGYLAVSGDRFSPWSKRILARVTGLYRAEGIQVFPGDAVTGANGNAAWLVFWRFRGTEQAQYGEIVAGLRQIYQGCPELLQFRLFRSSYDNATDHVALVEMHAPPQPGALDLKAFGAAARRIDMINTYTRYWRHGRLHGVLSG
jgi:hypothetical protein